MENFDELQNLWNQQSGSRSNTQPSDLIKKAEVDMKRLKIGQFLTIIILVILTLVLIAYFVWVGAHRLNALTVGLGIMIGVIIVRIMLEWLSVRKLKAIKFDSSMINFSTQMTMFYTWRRRIHVIFVPVIYGFYILGFTLLLPSFKENLSRGMYVYVLVSGFGSLFVLAFFIARQIKKETTILNVLKNN